MSSGGDTLSTNPTEKEKKDALYENRERKKIVRIITVTAYMFSVSFVGIVLSAYYIFLWHPPNPRMMHAQAMSVQSDGEIDFLIETSAVPNRLSRLANLAENDSTINVFSAQLDNEKTKTRREIIKNVNAVLRANFEKAKYSESSLQGADHIINNTTFLLHNNKENSVFNNDTLFGISKIGEILKMSTEKSSTNNTTSTSTSTMASSTRRTKNPGKKQHQTPFALKHLEVPIKQNESRRRSTHLITTSSTNKMLPTTSNIRGL